MRIAAGRAARACAEGRWALADLVARPWPTRSLRAHRGAGSTEGSRRGRMHYTTRSRTLTEQPTAVRRATLPAEQVGSWLADTYAQVAAYLERAGVPLSGPPYARYVFR